MLDVTAIGEPPLAYQWSKDGNAIAGATERTFPISSLQLPDVGTYRVTVSNSHGTDVSDPEMCAWLHNPR